MDVPYRPALAQLAQDTKKLAYRILKALALAMNLPQDYFVNCHQHILGKSNCYPI